MPASPDTLAQTEAQTPASVEYIFDGEWARVGGRLYVYPRDDGTFSIGRRESGSVNDDNLCVYDVETGFENMQAAVDQAEWLAGGL
jgi:hypothetical protein